MVFAPGLVAVALTLACGGGSSSPANTATPAGTVTFTVDATATATRSDPSAKPSPAGPRSVFEGAPVGEWAFGEPGVLPPGVAVYYYTGGYATEGGPGASHRALYLADGTMDVARLRPVLPEDERPPDYFEFSVAADAEFRTVFVGACMKSNCGYLDYAAPDAEAVLFRSTDGGLTWEPYGELERDWRVVGVQDRDTAILRYFGPDELQHPWRLHPGGQSFDQTSESEYPQFIEGWGNAFLVDTDVHGNRYVEYHLSDPNNLWHYIAKVSPQGRVLRAWEWEVTEFARPVAVVAPDLLIGSVLVDERVDGEDGRFYHVEAALLDMTTGLAHVLPEFSQGLTGNRHPWVTGVVADNFLVVDAPDSCLNLRAAASVTGQIIDCYAGGVLMRDRGESVTREGIEWRLVEAPDGLAGWAAAQFLLR